MKNFIPLDNTIDEALAITDCIDSIDNDVDTPVTTEVIQEEFENTENVTAESFEENKEEVTALVIVKPNSLFAIQPMFKKSIKISIKSFLISLSLGFLNLFL